MVEVHWQEEIGFYAQPWDVPCTLWICWPCYAPGQSFAHYQSVSGVADTRAEAERDARDHAVTVHPEWALAR